MSLGWRIDICCGVAVKFNFRCGVATKFRRLRSSETMYSGLYMSMHVNIASCIMLVNGVVLRWGGDWHRPPRPVRCSWAGPRETARRTAVTVIGNVSRGPAQLPWHGRVCNNLHYATISLGGLCHPWNWHVHPWRWYSHPWKVSCYSCCQVCPESVSLCLCRCRCLFYRCYFGE
jgi:hypothetical protein